MVFRYFLLLALIVIPHVIDFSAETESVVVNVLEKKVVLTFRLPTIGKVISQQITPVPKVAIIRRIFRSSRS